MPRSPNFSVIHQTAFPVAGIIFERETIRPAHTPPRERGGQSHYAEADLITVFRSSLVLRGRSVSVNNCEVSFDLSSCLVGVGHWAGHRKPLSIDRTTH